MTENEYHKAVDKAMEPLEKLADICTPEEMARLYDDVLEEMRILRDKYAPRSNT